MPTKVLAIVLKHYTLALDGTVQQLAAAVDIDGTALGTATTNIWVDDYGFQAAATNAANVTSIAYKVAASAPAALDKTNAAFTLAGGAFSPPPMGLTSERQRKNGMQINLRFFWAKGTAGDYLSVFFPAEVEITLP